MTRVCSDCPAPISVASKGRCRKCTNRAINASPEHRAKCAAAMRARMADPHYRARHVAASQAGIDRRMADPEYVESRRHLGRTVGALNIGSTRSEDVRAKAGRAISDTKLSDIPERFRAEYMALRSKGLTRAERMAVVDSRIADELRDAQRAIAGRIDAQRARREREKAQAYNG